LEQGDAEEEGNPT